MASKAHRKLSPVEVREIWSRLILGKTNESIASDYNCGPNNIASIRRGDTWAWLTAELPQPTRPFRVNRRNKDSKPKPPTPPAQMEMPAANGKPFSEENPSPPHIVRARPAEVELKVVNDTAALNRTNKLLEELIAKAGFTNKLLQDLLGVWRG